MSRSDIQSWGRSAWNFLHVVSWTFPEVPTPKDRQRMFEFMHSFASVLPCKHCRIDWQAYLSMHLPSPNSPHLASRKTFSTFLVDGHNYVNVKLNKPTVSYAAARSLFDPSHRRPVDEIVVFGYSACVVLVILGLFVVHRNTTKYHIR